MRFAFVPVKRCFTFIGVALVFAWSVYAQNLVVQKVKIDRHHNEKDRILVEKAGVLTFDDSAKALIFKDNAGDDLNVKYADVDKIVFEVDTHMRGGNFGTALLGAATGPVGAVVAGNIAGQRVNDYWMYVAPAANRGEPFLIEVPSDSSDSVINKVKTIFADRVTIAEFPQKSAEVDKNTLTDFQAKEVVKADKQTHPLPELKPDKALIVIVCPALSPQDVGARFYLKLFANGRVVAVNNVGTYSFVYLDPGKYALVSQAENASGFEMNLEAGQGYYFLESLFRGNWHPRTVLSRNSKELVMYKLDGAYYSDWKQ